MKRAGDFGLSAQGIAFDLDAVVKRSRGVAKQLNSGIGHLLKKNKVTAIMGEATLTGKGRVSVSPSGTLYFAPVKYIYNGLIKSYDLPDSF